MPEDLTVAQAGPPGRQTKQVRQAERARAGRLTRLPWLYDYARRGRRQALLTAVAQALLAIVPTLLLLRLVTGSWYLPTTGLWLIAAAWGQQTLFRQMNVARGRT